MSSSGHLREGDVALMMRVVDGARRDDPGPAMPWGMLESLLGLIVCDEGVQYMEWDVADERTRLCQDLAPDGRRDLWDSAHLDPALVERVEAGEEERVWWRLFWQDPLCSYRQRTGDERTVMHTGDFFPTRRDIRNRRIWRELPTTVTSVMIAWLPAAPGLERRVTFARAKDPAFGERDRQVLTLLRPHLQEIWLDAQRRRGTVPRLTPREWEVLQMTAAGLSHADIAKRLFVSTSTVSKHMEHVRERLGVHSAAAAAALALPHAPRPGTAQPLPGL